MRDTRDPNTQQASQIQKLLSIKKLHTGTTTHKWKFLDAPANSLYLANFELASRLVPNIFRHSSTSLQLLSCCSQTNTMHIQSDALQQLGNHTLSVTNLKSSTPTNRLSCSISAASCFSVKSAACSLLNAPAKTPSSAFSYTHHITLIGVKKQCPVLGTPNPAEDVILN